MVCDAVEIKDKNMKYFAIDLGIGMQLINIIRDIKEDAENKRVYIPVNLIGQVDPDDALNNQQVIDKIDIEKRKILKIAENALLLKKCGIKCVPKNNANKHPCAAGNKSTRQQHVVYLLSLPTLQQCNAIPQVLFALSHCTLYTPSMCVCVCVFVCVCV